MGSISTAMKIFAILLISIFALPENHSS